jgi:type IV pilus assembly protein PilO
LTINNVSLVAGKDRLLSMDAVAKTFRYLDKDEVSAQRQAAAPKKGKK